MATFRILYTDSDQENGGFFADVTADDAATAAWQQAVQSTASAPSVPPKLVAIAQLPD